MLAGLAGPLVKWGAILATLAALAGYAALERSWRQGAEQARALAQHERDAAIKIANDNVAILERERADMQRRLADLSALQERSDARARTLAAQLERNNRAPAADDGPVAPVLRRQLDGMRVRRPDGDAAPARPGAGGPGVLAQLPRAARPAGP